MWLLLSAGFGETVSERPIVKESAFDTVPADSGVYGLNPLSVTGNKERMDTSPIHAKIIERKEIEQSSANNLIDFLDGRPGFRKKIDCSVCNTAQIRMLGLNAAYTQFLLDGLPSYTGLGMVYGIEQIPLVNIKRVEIIKGAGNVKHGNNAIAGIVNVVTEAPRAESEVFLNMRYGHHNEQDYEGSYSGQIKKLGTQFAFSKNSSPALNMDGDIVQDVAEFDRSYFAGRFNLPLTSSIACFFHLSIGSEDRFGGTETSSRAWIGRIQLDSTYLNDWGDTLHQPLVYQEYVQTKRVSYETGVRAYLGNSLVNETRINMVEHYQDSYYGYLGIEAKQRLLHMENDFTWVKPKHEVLGGLAFHYDDFRDNRSIGAHEYIVPAVYMQDTYSPSQAWKLLGGVRYDYHNIHGSIVSPRLGIRFSGLKHFVFNLNGGTGFRTFNLFSENHMATTSDVYQLVPNQNLKAERTVTGMLTVGYATLIPPLGKSAAFNLECSFNHTRMEDYIQPYYLKTYTKYGQPYTNDGRQKVVYENLPGHTVARGVEVTGSMALPWGFSFNGGMNVLDNYNKREKEYGRIFYSPEYMATLAVSWESVPWGLKANADGNTVGPQLLREVRFGEDNLVRPVRESDPYYIINASAEKKIGPLFFSISVKNLTDFYQAREEPILYHRGWYVATTSVWAPLKGRTFYMGFRLKTGKNL